MFSTDFIFRQENLVDNQKCQAGFRPLCNKILFQVGVPVREADCFKILHELKGKFCLEKPIVS